MSLPLHPEQSRVKNQIVLNDDQGINKTAGNLSNHDRHLVAKAIEEYNQKGIGQFKKLTYMTDKIILCDYSKWHKYLYNQYVICSDSFHS